MAVNAAQGTRCAYCLGHNKRREDVRRLRRPVLQHPAGRGVELLHPDPHHHTCVWWCVQDINAAAVPCATAFPPCVVTTVAPTVSTAAPTASPMTPCARDALLANCVTWGTYSKHDNGCTAYAQGWPQGTYTCHSCGTTTRAYGCCDLSECNSFCEDLYSGATSQIPLCTDGCAQFSSLIASPPGITNSLSSG
eukprot:gene10744-biopygen84041